jgi:hypothetical protein
VRDDKALAYNVCEGANLLDPRVEPQIAVAVLERSRPLKASALCGRPESTDADGADGRPRRPPDSGAMLDRPDPFVAGARGLATYRRTGGRGRCSADVGILRLALSSGSERPARSPHRVVGRAAAGETAATGSAAGVGWRLLDAAPCDRVSTDVTIRVVSRRGRAESRDARPPLHMGDEAVALVRCAWRRAGRSGLPVGCALAPALARLPLSERGHAGRIVGPRRDRCFAQGAATPHAENRCSFWAKARAGGQARSVRPDRCFQGGWVLAGDVAVS